LIELTCIDYDGTVAPSSITAYVGLGSDPEKVTPMLYVCYDDWTFKFKPSQYIARIDLLAPSGEETAILRIVKTD